MLKECIDVFKRELDYKGERLLLDSYMPAEGTYIIVTEENGNFIIKDENIIDIKYDNKTKEPINSESELNKIRAKDYYSRLISTDKPIDKKKKIHSNNYLSLLIKKESFSDKIEVKKRVTNEIIEGYYQVLENPYLKYKDKNSKMIYKSIEDELGEVNSEIIKKIKFKTKDKKDAFQARIDTVKAILEAQALNAQIQASLDW